jgi:hypothetical protein
MRLDRLAGDDPQRPVAERKGRGIAEERCLDDECVKRKVEDVWQSVCGSGRQCRKN